MEQENKEIIMNSYDWKCPLNKINRTAVEKMSMMLIIKIDGRPRAEVFGIFEIEGSEKFEIF